MNSIKSSVAEFIVGLWPVKWAIRYQEGERRRIFREIFGEDFDQLHL